ncbi:MAG: hypothetical protein JW881_16790 [Spirochaetales bacterium]|nr:hypothetical protein [Spirochaetales bacterium]
MKDTDTVNDILSAMSGMDTETLRATLAYLLKVYVIDKQLQYEGNIVDNDTATPPRQRPIADFWELMTEMKRNYDHIRELNMFSVEGGNVFITLEHKRYQLTENETTEQSSKPPERKPPGSEEKRNATGGKGNDYEAFRKLDMDD